MSFSSSSRVPLLNTSTLTPYSYSLDNPPVPESPESVKSTTKLYEEDENNPEINVSADHSSVSIQMSKIFLEPSKSEIAEQKQHAKERRASHESYSPRIKNRVSPRNFTPSPRVSPHPLASNEHTSHDSLKPHSNVIFSEHGAVPVVDEKKTEKKPDFQSRIRRSSDGFFNKIKCHDQKEPSLRQISENHHSDQTQSSSSSLISKPRNLISSDEKKGVLKKFNSSNEAMTGAVITRTNSAEDKEKNGIALDKIEISNFDDLPKLVGDKARKHDQNFLSAWKSHIFPPSMYCDAEEVLTCVESLIRREVDPNKPKTQIRSAEYCIELSPRPKESEDSKILKCLQEELVRSCSIGKRLHEGIEFIIKHGNETGKRTSFTNYLLSAYKELISIIEMPNDSFGSNLDNFLARQARIDKKLFVENLEKNRDDELQKDNKAQKINENIKTVFERIYINGIIKKEIFEYLNLLNNPSEVFLDQFKNTIQGIKNNCSALRDVLCHEHLWREPLVHECESFVPIDRITFHDVFDYYGRHFREFPININGEKIMFEEIKDSELWFTLFSKLYAAHGLKVDKISLKNQIDDLKMCWEYEKQSLGYDDHYSKLSPEFLQCWRMLQLGTVNVWNRAILYWKSIFNCFDYMQWNINYSENIGLNFHVDLKGQKKVVVEQIKKLKFLGKKDSKQLYAIIPVSWKTSFPSSIAVRKGQASSPKNRDQNWEFILTPQKLETYSDVTRNELNRIIELLIKFNKDENISSGSLPKVIKIECRLNDDLKKNEHKLEMQILPAENKDPH